MKEKNGKKVFIGGEIPTELDKKIREKMNEISEALFAFVKELSPEERNQKIIIILQNLKGIFNSLSREIEGLKK